MPKRTLPGTATIALDVIASMRSRRLPLHEFELRMHERGCNAVAVAGAIAALERRGWAMRHSGILEVTEPGEQAAIRGVAQVAPRRSARSVNTRMPRGLFN